MSKIVTNLAIISNFICAFCKLYCIFTHTFARLCHIIHTRLLPRFPRFYTRILIYARTRMRAQYMHTHCAHTIARVHACVQYIYGGVEQSEQEVHPELVFVSGATQKLCHSELKRRISWKRNDNLFFCARAAIIHYSLLIINSLAVAARVPSLKLHIPFISALRTSVGAFLRYIIYKYSYLLPNISKTFDKRRAVW